MSQGLSNVDDEEMADASTTAGASFASAAGVTPESFAHQVHQAAKVDLNNIGRGIWLVKVPKYLATRWERISGDVEAAKLKITKEPGSSKPNVTLSLSEATLCLKEKDEQDIPKEHELVVQSMATQSLAVFATEEEEILLPPTSPTENGEANKPEVRLLEKVSMEGIIQQRLDCRPVADNNYLQLKLNEMKKFAQPKRQVIQLERAVNTYKPVSDHKHNKEFEERKKAEGKKSRDDKDKVLELLFSAFEKHQYYNIKDLITMTNQPVGYLKEVLKEVCNYCMKNPHKNMWELKPEYRHYKSTSPGASGKKGGDDDDDDDELME